MRRFPAAAAITILLSCWLGAFAGQVEAEETVTPLYNVEIVDAEGVRTRLSGFHRSAGENMFRGFVGSADVEVPYARVREIRVQAPERPGGRPRALLTLRSGREVAATYDQREAEQLFQGFTTFGRVRVFFRDIRRLRFLGRTARGDLPKFGPPARGVDARVRDDQGVEVEVLGLRRAAADNVVPGLYGALRIDIPLRIIKTVSFRRKTKRPGLTGRAQLRSGESVSFTLPVFTEEAALRGEAEFGAYRIRLGKVRRMTVHRTTPALRPLDPRAAAEGREVGEGEPSRKPPTGVAKNGDAGVDGSGESSKPRRDPPRKDVDAPEGAGTDADDG